MYVCMLVRNRLPNHACYGDEAFASDSVGLGLGHRLNVIFKKGTFGAKSPLMSKYCLSKAKFKQVPCSNLALLANSDLAAGM